MTISSTTRKAGPFSGTGAQTAYPFAFKVFAASDVLVVRTDTAGVETTLTLTTDYTVALNADQNSTPGGTVTMLTAPPSGYLLTIGSAVQATQGQSIPNQGGFYPKVIENALDKLTINVQQLAESVTRSVKFAFSDSSSGTLPTTQQRANNLLAFDANGNPVAVAPSAQSATALQNLLAAAGGAAMIGFNPTGVGAAATTVQAALDQFNQKQTGHFFSDQGGKVNRIADRLFIGDAVVHDGKASPVTATWVKSVSSGIYEYLESNATLVAPSTKGIGTFSAARSSTGGGTANDAAIGVAGFAYNDYVGGLGGVWGMYSTVLRKAGVNGPTHGMEIDVGNLGTTAVSYPNAMNPAGLTDCLWLCTGGETTNNTAVGTASMAIGIFRNDSQATPSAAFDKGIVFHAKALAGTDGATGTGTAIAMATCQLVSWYTNSNQQAGYIYSAVTGAAGQGLLFTDGGLQVRRITDSTINAAVRSVANAANYIELVSAVAGSPATVQANGSDANADLVLAAKGTGCLRASYGSTPATSPAAFSAARYLPFKDANNIQWYIPLATATW